MSEPKCWHTNIGADGFCEACGKAAIVVNFETPPKADPKNIREATRKMLDECVSVNLSKGYVETRYEQAIEILDAYTSSIRAERDAARNEIEALRAEMRKLADRLRQPVGWGGEGYDSSDLSSTSEAVREYCADALESLAGRKS